MTIRRRRQLAVLLAWGATVAALRAQEAAQPLEPAWTWPADATIEWAELVGSSQTPAILGATADGRLHLINVATGKPRFGLPIVAARGVRPAGHAVEKPPALGEQIYCFDRHAAYAVCIAEPSGLAWRFGQPPAEGTEFPGDPETLCGWSLVETAVAGLLLVNTDGRVVLLSHATGRPLWEINLGPLPVARLHVWETTAAVLWKNGGVVRAAFLTLDEQRRPPIQRDLGDAWPVWSTLVREGLLTVSPHEATVWPSTGPPRRMPLGISEFATQAVVAWTAAARTRLLVGDGAYLSAFDMITGARLWHRDLGSLARVGISSLGTQADRVIVASDVLVLVYDAFLGEIVAGCPLRDAVMVSAWISGPEAIDVLCRARGGASPALRLARVASFDGPVRTFDLQPASEIRHVLWSGRHVVLVEPHRLVAYRLP